MSHAMYSTSAFGGDNVVHDQLPSIEEARLQAMRSLEVAEHFTSSRNSYRLGSSSRLSVSGAFGSRGLLLEQRRRRRKNWAIAAMGLGVVCILVGIIVLASEQRKETKSQDGITLDDSAFSRVSDVRHWLLQNKIVEPTDLKYRSPQTRAMEWIADEDGFTMPLPRNGNQFEFVQRYALAVLYYALDGENWVRKHNYHFLSERETCAWNNPKIAPDGRRFSLGVTCNLSGQVAAIHIRK
mmetsp:Transcript_31113/g.44170  ORF Transcript_31113/g.44170 Transcript_31113/m.44170 type:complete len:239 (-) Transcript_31113:29-745(-)